jgi:hypothetical protein
LIELERGGQAIWLSHRCCLVEFNLGFLTRVVSSLGTFSISVVVSSVLRVEAGRGRALPVFDSDSVPENLGVNATGPELFALVELKRDDGGERC